ncbi:MAG: nicotinate (nicotinamide) nucleotide adenylyltransferase [Synechococcales bacterium]|nr:nicotinate (nicotinamide) nucleotide adenylyltransferase [Synechococcales bacterium]
MMVRTGILGGTFDPPHWGHWAIAQASLHQESLDQVFWIPTAQPTYKSRVISPLWHRLAMVERAIAQIPAFKAIDLQTGESPTTEPFYAIDLMQLLQQRFPNRQWAWILGEDAFRRLPDWVAGDRLAACCTWLVAPRSEQPQAFSHPFFHQVNWQWLQMPWLPISSTQVRSAIQVGQAIDPFLCPSVVTYIQQFHLYRSC